MRLRAAPVAIPFHVVLVEPEIPPNTGNVARLCAATGSPLHLVGKLGFRIDEQSVRRAGVDYWHLVDVRQHQDFGAFETAFAGEPTKPAGGGTIWMFSAHATVSLYDAPLRPGDALVFGKESVGLDPELVARFPASTVGIPTLGAVRSLNLANAATLGIYEALRRNAAFATTFSDG